MNRTFAILALFALSFVTNACEKKTEIGTMTDSRDGQTYRTVKIGEQVWMAENLNFKTDSSWCYNDEESNCQKYGRLYSWNAARSACPVGWHLPSKKEFEILIDVVGGVATAGLKLKSVSGWFADDKRDGNGEDAFSFAVLPAGGRSDGGDYSEARGYMSLFSSTEENPYSAYVLTFGFNMDNADMGGGYKNVASSVRCVKDSQAE